MSRLVFSGDLNKNFGEFYPTPYIDHVTLTNPTVAGSPVRSSFVMSIKHSLLFNIPEHDPALPNKEIDYVRSY